MVYGIGRRVPLFWHGSPAAERAANRLNASTCGVAEEAVVLVVVAGPLDADDHPVLWIVLYNVDRTKHVGKALDDAKRVQMAQEPGDLRRLEHWPERGVGLELPRLANQACPDFLGASRIFAVTGEEILLAALLQACVAAASSVHLQV